WKSVLFDAGINRPEQVISESSIWTTDNSLESACIALLPEIKNNRLVKEWIELWLSNNGQQNLTLWLDGKTAQYSSMSELRTLVELMGY
ncbi:MAG: hypothetical protein IMF15_09710, partial [Proteobacteria bacterium]|nr:hypothetical protein [Pseudomonadota bacterium]